MLKICQKCRFQVLSPHPKKYEEMDMLISLTTVIISLCISNQVVYFTYIEFLLNKKNKSEGEINPFPKDQY